MSDIAQQLDWVHMDIVWNLQHGGTEQELDELLARRRQLIVQAVRQAKPEEIEVRHES